MSNAVRSLSSLSLEAYLEQLASEAPAPGGGAVVALLGAQACALLAMTLRVSGETTHNSDKKGEHSALLTLLDDRRAVFLRLADDDAKAFTAVLAAYKLPKGDEDAKKARGEAVQKSFKEATRVPLQGMAELAALMDVVDTVSMTAKASVASDTGIALQLVVAALQASRYNVWINLKYLIDPDFKAEAKKSARRHLSGVKERRRALHQRLKTLIQA